MRPKGICIEGLEPAVHGIEPKRSAFTHRKKKKGMAHERSDNRGKTRRREGIAKPSRP